MLTRPNTRTNINNNASPPDSRLSIPRNQGQTILYLHIGEPHAAADSEATPEGHVLRFNDQGEVIGLTIINAKWLLQRDRAINITIPEHIAVTPDALAEALAAA